MNLLCYGDSKEKICLEFYPCKNKGEDMKWEDWHKSEPLTVFKSDYQQLLIDYFTDLFPVVDPTTGENQEYFDVCFDHWIGKNDWIRLIEKMKKGIDSLEGKAEIDFYIQFIKWIEKRLEWAEIIVVDGNQ